MKRAAKDITIDDTGERMVPEFNKGTIIYGEHMARYHSLAEIVSNKVVLDIASGSGYGTALIAQHAKHVFGVDVSPEAIEYAKKNFNAKNVEYKIGDGAMVPLEDNSVDVVVSFETIEHIKDYKRFMSEIKRVLTPEGILIISTPNDDEYSEENHFHIHEFRHEELKKLISSYYKNHEMYYQIDSLYSVLLPEELMGTKEWETPLRTYQYAPNKKEKAIYFLAVCSDKPIKNSVQGIGVISEHWSELKNHEKEMIFKKHMDDQALIISHLEREKKDITNKLEALASQLERAQDQLNRIKKFPPVKVLIKGAHFSKKIKGNKS